jgi:cytochrome c-type biogenesis protein CcmH
MKRRLAAAALVATLTAIILAPAAATATPAPRASLTDIENDVMCVSCREPLAVAQSPQAYAERNYIRGLIAQGQTKAQIEQALVGQYGPAVLGKPPAHGFNLTVYILPPAIVLLGIGTLVLLLPKWRRRQQASAAARGPNAQP